MSQENVELVRRAFEAFANGGAHALVEPDPGWMEEDEYRGRDAFIGFNKTQSEVFGNFTVEIHDIRAVGDRVLVLAEFIGRAEGSGVPIRQKAAHVLSDFRDGMIGEDRTFLSWDGGLKAVGLEE